MTKERLTHLVSRFGLMGALTACAAALPACGGDFEVAEDLSEAEAAIGYPGDNNTPPYIFDSDPLARGTTNSHGITSSSNADPVALCAAGTVTESGCMMRAQWENWMNADVDNRVPMMKAIAKCAVSSSFSIENAGGTLSFPGQWSLYPSWKSNRLNGQDKRERVSSCILTLLNGNNEELLLCIIGPGGAPFSDACDDPTLNIREGGFFGDLFAQSPTAYVAGPDSADPVDSGRACFATSGNYCCPEDNPSCSHRIVLAGAIVGAPEQNYANRRCNAELVDAGGGLYYCPSFFSTREPGRSYTNVFTTFVPPAQ